MRFDDLARLRPLFLVALVLSWNASLISINAQRDFMTASLLCVFATANLALAFITGFARHAHWARALAPCHSMGSAMMGSRRRRSQ